MKIFEFKKLIRNKLPARMEQENVIVNKRILNSDEYDLTLRKKLLEEATEVIEAESKEELIIELADLLEVIYTIAENHKLKLSDIEEARLVKKLANGAFDNESYVDFIEVSEDNQKVIDYLSKRNRPYIFQET